MKEEQPGIEAHFPVVAIAASAGGLEAFRQLVNAIPAETGMAFVLMQHLDPSYETTLAEILQRETVLPVNNLEVEPHLEAGKIYIVPSGKLVTIKDAAIQLAQRPANVHPLFSIDVFFTAIAELYQAQAIGILLSGMGTDGTAGLKKIKDYGGVTIAQTASSAKYPSMPQHAIDEGVVDFEMLPEEMPAQLSSILQKLNDKLSDDKSKTTNAEDEAYYKQVITFLRLRREVDFTYYKQSTIRRRILRRMVITRVESFKDYIKFLEEHAGEIDILYDDLLIPVTSFFRDSAIFANLCEKVFPSILKHKPPLVPIRIWVAGCSTGEEAYSMAICLHEYLGDRVADIKVQLFATDLSEKAIRKARNGFYSVRELEGINPHRLEEFFIKSDGQYLIKKEIRDLCVFAAHNFLKDPPFARMDFISCRNVLIYMDSYLQKKAMAIFHYALNENGILLLGKSESAGSASNLFKVLGKQEKFYSRKILPGRAMRILPELTERNKIARELSLTGQKTAKIDFEKNADDVLLAKYIPAGVVVNEHFEIVQFRGSTGMFLEASPGKASLNILKMAREGLSFEIRTALHKAKERRETIVKKDIPISAGKTLVSIEVSPLLQTIELYFLIVFKEENIHPDAIATPETKRIKELSANENDRIRQLEKELGQLREDMRTITEDQEAANEELQSANEELLSGSEELQSLNEELETSKEELQSSNEELITVNQELYDRNEQYNLSRIYAEAVVNTIREPLLVLTRDLRIKSANPSFHKYFNLSEDTIRGKILFELQENNWDIPDLRTQLLKIQTGQLQELEWEVDFSFAGLAQRNILLKAQPVMPGNGDQLILLAFEDITLRKQETERLKTSAAALKAELKLIEQFFMQVPAMFCILRGPTHIFEFANPPYLRMSGGEELKGKSFADVFPELGNEGYKDILDNVYKTGVPFSGREMKAANYPGEEKLKEAFIDLSCQAYHNDKNEIKGVLFFAYEVTNQALARKQVEENAALLETIVTERTAKLEETNIALEQSNRNLDAFASVASHDLQEPLRKIKTFISILRDRYAGQLPPEAGKLILKTEVASNRMSALIKDVLNFSRIAYAEDSFLPVDLNAILGNVMDDFELQTAEKNAQVLVKNTLPVIEGVPSQMNQLFYNLLSNSLKFISKHHSPEITISSRIMTAEEIATHDDLEPAREYYLISFSDNGIGFDPEYAEQVFSIFERLNSSTDYEGTGIGLALCRKIVLHHKGLILAESKKDSGSNFSIILPARQTGINIVKVIDINKPL